ncbi:MAG: InlB B-repeat-containing protein [Eubacteriales bacterium]|nr:InlB B-repeat-containing protein [Eubacteriales bacterium]
MTKLKHAVFGIGLFVMTGAVTIPSYAYYRGETLSAHNQFSISHVSLVFFSPNGGSGVMGSTSIPLGHGYTVPLNTFTKTGYTFTGWNLDAAGSGISISDGGCVDDLPGDETSTTLHAIWRPNTYTVVYDANGGSGAGVPSSSCTYDAASSVNDNSFSLNDHLFIGWNTKADGSGTSITPGGSILNLSSKDKDTVTLYAQWEDESAPLIETSWNKNLELDADKNGTPDRLELVSGASCIKDPSLKNHSSKRSYAYMLVSVPTIAAKLSGDSSFKVYDAVIYTASPHWVLIKSSVSSSTSKRSVYLYRYDTVLEAKGTSQRNPYHSLRYADRTDDLFSSFSVQNFTSAEVLASSLNVSGLFIEASVTAESADRMAVETLTSTGSL